MADRGKRLDECLVKRIVRLGQYTPKLRLARDLGVSRNTVKKYLRKPLGSLTTT